MNLQDDCKRILSRHADAPERFELTVKEAYSSVLFEGAIALDLGAHTGKHALPMGRAVGASGHVFAFEPIVAKFRRLTENLEKSGLAQVSPLNACCLDENKLVTFTYLPDDPGKSAIHLRKSLEGDTVEKIFQQSLAVRLDDFFGSDVSPAFIKIDIEGAELAAMRGARAMITRARPIVHVEIGPPSLEAFGVRSEDIYEFLSGAGYALIDVLGHSLDDIETFVESVYKTKVYDYFAIPHGDSRRATVVRACERMWLG